MLFKILLDLSFQKDSKGGEHPNLSPVNHNRNLNCHPKAFQRVALHVY